MKNLFLKDKSDNFHLVCIGAHNRLKIKDFGRVYGLKELSFGSPESMMQQLHVTPGSVSIFGIMYQTNTKLYIDPAIIDQPSIGRHPNDNTMTLVLSYQELIKFLHMIGVTPIIVKD
jgi:Ala-tRNA(Pro) deacylase